MRRPASRWFAPLLAAPLLLAGCGNDKSDKSEKTGSNEQVGVPPKVRVEDPLEPLPALRTGTSAPAEHAELKGALAAYRVEGEAEYLEVKLPIAGDDLGLDWDRLHVELVDGAAGAIGVLATATGASEAVVQVRRPKSASAGWSQSRCRTRSACGVSSAHELCQCCGPESPSPGTM